MRQLQRSNIQILRYIQQYYEFKSRYEIDYYLVEQGYNPSKIDLIWDYIQEIPLVREQENLLKINRDKQDFASMLSSIAATGGILFGLLGLAGVAETGYDIAGRLVPYERTLTTTIVISLVLGLSVTGFIGARFAAKSIRLASLLQWFAEVNFIVLSATTGLTVFFLPLAIMLGIGSSITLSTEAKMPNYMQNSKSLILINLIFLTIVYTGLLTINKCMM